MKIGMTYDLRRDYLSQGLDAEQTAEFDSDETIDGLERTLRGLGHDVDRIGNARELCRRLVAGDRWDLVFNVAEGLGGRCREAQVPAVLELYGVPYTFGDPLACAATLDKSVAKRIVGDAGIPTPSFAVIHNEQDWADLALEFPLFVKPLAEGTGKGVDAASRVTDEAQLAALCGRLLERFPDGVLVEEYLPGMEFTVGVLGNGRAARALGTMLIEISDKKATSIYSFDMKEHCEGQVTYRPMPRGGFRADVEATAVSICGLLGCRDAARLDFRVDRFGQPSFIEANPLPGLHPTHSDLPMIATQEGMTYSQLIDAIVNSALERTGTGTCAQATAC